jgi:hypothetical protein
MSLKGDCHEVEVTPICPSDKFKSLLLAKLKKLYLRIAYSNYKLIFYNPTFGKYHAIKFSIITLKT